MAVLPATVFGATYEPQPPPSAPPFCAGKTVRDYLAPFDRMRELHAPLPGGRLGFAPSSLALEPLPSVLLGDESVGYTLALRRLYPPEPAVHPNWDVTSSLTRVDRRGRSVELLRRTKRHVTTISKERSLEVRFPVADPPAFYRVTAVFRNGSGRKLGGYGFYFRVMSKLGSPGMTLTASSYRPGEMVVGRVDNLGPDVVSYGAPYAIERLEGAAWIKAPESPRGPWILPAYSTLPGETGKFCSIFRIPPQMPPGRYRMSKEADVSWPPARREPIQLSAEFEIVS